MSADEEFPLSSGGAASRFVTEKEVVSAREKRDEEWKAAYERLGQKPPPKPVEDVYDGRSLAEKLVANKIAKQEEWEERNKLSNQFRALEEDEVNFLDSMVTKLREEERERKAEEVENLDLFRREVSLRQKKAEQSNEVISNSDANKAPLRTQVVKKKPNLKGIQLKRKQNATGKTELSGKPSKKARLEDPT